jgi:hypothetical protein
MVGQADAGTTADSSDLKATPPGVPVAQRVIPRCRHQSLTAILPDRLLAYSQLRKGGLGLGLGAAGGLGTTPSATLLFPEG